MDIFKDGLVWEVKHKKSMQYAQAQACGYIGSELINEQGSIKGLGDAGAFKGEFVINCLGQSYTVSYYTPKSGVVIYDVAEREEYEPNPFKVVSVKKYEQMASKNAVSLVDSYGNIGGAAIGAGVIGVGIMGIGLGGGGNMLTHGVLAVH